MAQADENFSTTKISPELISRIIDAIKNKAYGSVEIYIQSFTVTQISERTITKLKGSNGQKTVSDAKGKRLEVGSNL